MSTTITPPDDDGGWTFEHHGMVHRLTVTEHPDNPNHQRWLVDTGSLTNTALLSTDAARALGQMLLNATTVDPGADGPDTPELRDRLIEEFRSRGILVDHDTDGQVIDTDPQHLLDAIDTVATTTAPAAAITIPNRQDLRDVLIQTFRDRGILGGGHTFELVVEADLYYLMDAILTALATANRRSRNRA